MQRRGKMIRALWTPLSSVSLSSSRPFQRNGELFWQYHRICGADRQTDQHELTVGRTPKDGEVHGLRGELVASSCKKRGFGGGILMAADLAGRLRLRSVRGDGEVAGLRAVCGRRLGVSEQAVIRQGTLAAGFCRAARGSANLAPKHKVDYAKLDRERVVVEVPIGSAVRSPHRGNSFASGCGLIGREGFIRDTLTHHESCPRAETGRSHGFPLGLRRYPQRCRR